MNPFAQIIGQVSSIKPPKPAPAVAPKPPRIKLSAVRWGSLIDARYRSGERIVDIASDLGLSYGGARGMYSVYRKYVRQGLISK